MPLETYALTTPEAIRSHENSRRTDSSDETLKKENEINSVSAQILKHVGWKLRGAHAGLDGSAKQPVRFRYDGRASRRRNELGYGVLMLYPWPLREQDAADITITIDPDSDNPRVLEASEYRLQPQHPTNGFYYSVLLPYGAESEVEIDAYWGIDPIPADLASAAVFQVDANFNTSASPGAQVDAETGRMMYIDGLAPKVRHMLRPYKRVGVH